MNRLNNKVRVLVISLVLGGFPVLVSAQSQKSWQWVERLGGDSWDVATGIVCDSKNNLFVAGSYFNTINCDSKSAESKGNQDIFISKFDESGKIKNLWSIGGSGADMATCISLLPEDKIFIGGTLSDSADFGKLKTKIAGKKLFLTKMENDGSFLWVTEISVKSEANLYLSTADKSGNIFVSGFFTGKLEANGLEVQSNGKKDIFIAQINSKGILTRLFSAGSREDDIPSAIAIDDSSNLVLSGEFGNNIQFDKLKLIKGEKDIKTNAFIVGFDNNLKPKWSQSIFVPDYCEVKSVKVDKAGNIYAGGSFNSKMILQDTTFHSLGNTDGFILKFKSDGSLNWGRSFGSQRYDYLKQINVDNLGGVIVSGSIGESFSLDSIRLNPINKKNSALILQFSPDGRAIWGDCISGSGNATSSGSVLDSNGNLYYTGYFMNEFEKGNSSLISAGDQDIFIAKYSNCITKERVIRGQPFFCPGLNTKLSLNRTYSNIIWNDTIINKYNIIADKEGQYWVSALDEKGCTLSDTMQITEKGIPYFSLGKDTTISVSDTLILNAPDPFDVDRWHDLSTEREYVVRSDNGHTGEKLIWLTMKDSLGCQYTDTISVYFTKTGNNTPMNLLVNVHPNPTRDRIWWSLSTEEDLTLNTRLSLTIDITSENGIKLYHQRIDNYKQGEEREINIKSLYSGIYYLRFNELSDNRNFKLIRVVKY